MSLYKIIFSPTGGTDCVADVLAKEMSMEYKTIDISYATIDFSNIFHEDDICIFAVPAFGGRVPDIAVKRLKHFSGNHAKAIIIAVYGNRAYEDTLIELKDIVEETGFTVVAGISAVAEHSIVREIGKGRPDGEDIQTLKDMASKIKGKIDEKINAPKQELFLSPEISGNRPYRTYNPLPIKIFVNNDCIHCGLCAKECPTQAIYEENSVLEVNENCISCMRCIKICPVKARYADTERVEFLKNKLQQICQMRKEYELFL